MYVCALTVTLKSDLLERLGWRVSFPIVLHCKINEKALKCKPSANCACTIPLIDWLGRLLVVSR